MSFWSFILAVIVGMAAFVLIVVIVALLMPPPTKERMEEVDKRLERDRRDAANSKPKPSEPPYPYIF